jgi:hypothetical protein
LASAVDGRFDGWREAAVTRVMVFVFAMAATCVFLLAQVISRVVTLLLGIVN